MPQEGLFDEPAHAGRDENRKRSRRPVMKRTCDLCGQEVGLFVLAYRAGTGRVLQFGRHYRRTHGGGVFVCRRSGTEVSA